MIKQLTLKSVRTMPSLKIKVYKSKLQTASYNSIMEAIRESEEEIKNGRLYDGEEVLKELRKKYGYR